MKEGYGVNVWGFEDINVGVGCVRVGEGKEGDGCWEMMEGGYCV